jgi:hypothetical protein
MTPLSPGRVIGRAWEVYRDQAGVLLPAALGVFALQAILALVLTGALAAVAGLLGLVLTIFYQGMVVQLVRDVQDGRRDASVGDLFRSVAPVFWPLLAVAILFGLGVGIGFVLLVVPGLFLLTIWSVTAPVTVIEQPGILRAFGRSRALVRGYGWPVFGVIVLVFLVAIAVSIVAGLIAAPLGDGGQTVVQWIVNALLAPLAALTSAVLYFTLRELRGETRAGASGATDPMDAPEEPTAPGPA